MHSFTNKNKSKKGKWVHSVHELSQLKFSVVPLGTTQQISLQWKNIYLYVKVQTLPYIDMAASNNHVVQSGIYFSSREAYKNNVQKNWIEGTSGLYVH